MMIPATGPRSVTVPSVIMTVVAVAALGLVLGAGFGYAAGVLAPQVFEQAFTFSERAAKVEPRSAAVLLGAFGGLMLGGGLGAFAVLMQVTSQWIAMRRELGR